MTNKWLRLVVALLQVGVYGLSAGIVVVATCLELGQWLRPVLGDLTLTFQIMLGGGLSGLAGWYSDRILKWFFGRTYRSVAEGPQPQ